MNDDQVETAAISEQHAEDDGVEQLDEVEDVSSAQEQTMSKNQLKKQRKRERWLVIKQERRRHIKQNRKRRLAELREKGEDLGPTRKSLKSNTMKSSSCKIRVVLDLSLDEYMAEKDVNSLSSQLQHSYSANRRAQNPLQLYLCSLGGKTKQRLDEIGDYKGWDVYLETESYEQLFPKERLVYLTSESPNILSTLSEDKVYIIGGLVDHNKHKGLCHKIAEEKGIAHAQLPIAEYLDMKTRKVLAINHVFSILLRYTETHDWKTAFLAELPQRKQAHLKEENAEADSGLSGKADRDSSRVCVSSAAHEDSSAAPEESSAAHEDSSAAHEDSSAAHEDSSAAHEDSSAAHEDSSAAHKDNSAAHEDSSAAHKNSSTAHEDSSKNCINKLNDAEVNGAHDEKLHSCSSEENTPEQTSLISCTEQISQEVNEEKFSVGLETDSTFCVSTQGKIQNIGHVNSEEITEKSNDYLNITTS